MYLLDTNHCSLILQGHDSILQKLSVLNSVSVATCVIVQGELVFMAEKSVQKTENLQRVHQFLKHIRVYSIDAETADIYGKLKAEIIDHFGPKAKAKRRHIKIERLGFGENDLWIAAVSKRHGLTIVSADSDFRRLQQVESLQVENWLEE